MLWRDFFYFSKGERRGLILLLCLIAVASILLILNDQPEPEANFRSAEALVESGRSDTLPEANLREPAGGADRSGDRRRVAGREKSESDGGASKSVRKKESVPERVTRLTSYPSPSASRPAYVRTEKFPEGTVVELNTADTAILKKVPGIGAVFARRIVNYRNLLGGYYSVTQLGEVYGIDEDRYNALLPWFSADPSLISRLNVNLLSQDSLRRHPYINYGQAKVMTQLRRQKGKLTGWENLLLLNEFTDDDRIRLQHYLSFE
jgi:DNA uptake protein ComE-like DNA-binding protein